MRFQSTTAIGALFTIASSNIALAQDAGAKYSSDLQNYITATLVTESAFLAIETNSADIAALASAQTMDLNTQNPQQISAVVAGLPTGVQSLVASIINVASGIAVKDGFKTTATGATAAAAAAAAAATTDSSSSTSTNSETSSTATISSAAEATGGASRDGMDISLLAGSLLVVMGIAAAL